MMLSLMETERQQLQFSNFPVIDKASRASLVITDYFRQEFFLWALFLFFLT